MSFSCLEGINPGNVRQFELNKACNYPHCRIKLFNIMSIFQHAYVTANAPFCLVHSHCENCISQLTGSDRCDFRRKLFSLNDLFVCLIGVKLGLAVHVEGNKSHQILCLLVLY